MQHLMDEGLSCVVRTDHPEVGSVMTRRQFERLRHVNVVLPGRMRAGLLQTLHRQGLRHDVAVSVTNFLAVPELVAVTDFCSTLPNLLCRRLAGDARLKVLPPPVDLGSSPLR